MDFARIASELLNAPVARVTAPRPQTLSPHSSLEAISKKGFWFKIEADARIKPQEYSSISRI
jgi:hypothetical protein